MTEQKVSEDPRTAATEAEVFARELRTVYDTYCYYRDEGGDDRAAGMERYRGYLNFFASRLVELADEVERRVETLG
jgi:hypothetical protein